MKTLLTIIAFFIAGICFSQTLHIAQNVAHCGFGLKNDSDNWVVQPVYASIKYATTDKGANLRYDGWIISDGIYYGLIDSAGKVVFQPRFKDVKSYFAIPEKNIFEPKQKPKIGGDSILYIPEYCDYYKVKGGYNFFFAYNHEGFADSLGNVLTDKLYYSVDYFHYGYACVRVNENDNYHYGFINKSGKEIVPVIYENISPSTKSGVYVSGKSGTGFISWRDGKFVSLKMHYYSTLSGDSIFIGTDGKKFSLLGDHGNLLSKEYDTIMVNYSYIKNPRVCVVKENGKTGLLTVTGKILLANCDSIAYEKMDSYDEGRYYYVHIERDVLFERRGKWGMFSDSLGITIQPMYSEMEWLDDKKEYCWALKGKQFHAFKINNSGAKEIPFSQFFSMNSSGDFITLAGGFQTFEADENGKLVGKPFPWAYFQDDEYVLLPEEFQTIRGKSGIGIAKLEDNTIIVPPIFKTASIFGKYFSYYHEEGNIDDGNFYVETFGGHYGVYSQEGRKIVDTIYTSLTSYDPDNFCWIGKKDSGEWDLIRWNPVYAEGWDPKTGKVVATSNSEFKKSINGIFVITENGFENLYDLQNEKYIIQNKFKTISPIENGYFIVTDENTGTGLMNDDGKMVIDSVYDHIYPVTKEILLLNKNGETGLADLSGNILLPLSKKPFAFRNVKLDTIIDIQNIYFNSTDGISVSLADTSNNLSTVKIANNFLIDSLIGLAEFSENYFDNFQLTTIGEDNIYYYNEESIENDYSVAAVSKCSFTLSLYYSYWFHGGGNSDFTENTYLIRNDSIVKIGLYDILRTDTSYQSLNDSIREMISRSDDNNGEFFFDCSNPEKLSPDYFSIDDDGITFSYVNDNEEANEDGSVDIMDRMQSATLTWKQLNKFMRKDTAFYKSYGKQKVVSKHNH